MITAFAWATSALTADPSVATYRIQGHCVDQNDNPLADVRVQIYRVDLNELSQELCAETRTQATGEFDFPDLPPLHELGDDPPHYVLVASHPDFASIVRPFFPPHVASLGVTITLPASGRLCGRVTDSAGNPVVGARVMTTSAAVAPFGSVLNTVTDADGRYALTDIRAKPRPPLPKRSRRAVINVVSMFKVTHPEFATALPTYSEIPTTVDVVLSPASVIAGRVIDRETGLPAGGVLVKAQGVRNLLASPSVLTDNTGSYRFSTLAAGAYNIWAEAPDRTCVAYDSLLVAEGETLEQQDLDLISGGWIEGRLIRSSTGEPLAQTPEGQPLRIALHGPSRPKSGAAVHSVLVKPDGSFRFHCAPGLNFPYIQSAGFRDRIEGWDVFKNGLPVAGGETTRVEFRITDEPKPGKPGVILLR